MTQGDSSDMTPEEMAADLEKLMKMVGQKFNTFHGQKKAADSQMAKSQDTAIAALFQVLQKNGIDPSNQLEVNNFLTQLQQQNPEGYQMFELAINNLLGQKDVLGQQQAPAGMAEPLNPMDQLGTEPMSPAGIDPNAPVNDVSKIPTGPMNAGNAQPLPPVAPPNPPPPSGIPMS